MTNCTRNATAKSIAVVRRIAPPHIVATQLKILTPVGTAMSRLEAAKTASATRPSPTANMWCAQTPKREDGDRDRRAGDERVTEDGLAREDRDDLGDHPEGREHHDVDLGVTEAPEVVLPHDGRAAARRQEQVGAEEAVDQKQHARRGQRGEREHGEHRVDQHHPHEERNASQRHPRRAQGADRRDEVDRARHGADAEHDERDGPVVRAVVDARERSLAEGRVAEPADVRRAAREPAEVQEKTAERKEPVGHRVQAWERHVARADHEGHDVVGESRERGHHDEEDHRRPVHREDLVVRLGRQEVRARDGQLQAHEQRLAAADEEEDERRPQVEDADALVIGRADPFEPPRIGGGLRGGQRNRRCGHRSSSR